MYCGGDIHCVAPAPIIQDSCHSSGSLPVSLRQQVGPSELKPQGFRNGILPKANTPNSRLEW